MKSANRNMKESLQVFLLHPLEMAFVDKGLIEYHNSLITS